MSFKAVGSPILEQPVALTFDRQTGSIITRRWRGLSNAVLAEASIQSQFCDNLQFESTGAAASLSARYGGPQDGSSEVLSPAQFEIRGEEITQSIWKHLDYSGVPMSIQKATRVAAESDNIESESLANILHACALAYPVDNDAKGIAYEKAHKIYKLLVDGTENYLVDQSYVFIRSRTGSRNYQAVLEFVNDGKIWSTGQVASYVGDPAPFNVPSLPALANSEDLLLAFGWRKRPTDVTKIANGNQQITESWQAARWTMLLYRVAVF